MSDIRKFFTPDKTSTASPKKSALSLVRAETGSPVKKKKTLKKVSPVKRHSFVEDEDDSDFESPAPSSLKASAKSKVLDERKARRNRARVILDGSDEDFFENYDVEQSKKQLLKPPRTKKRSTRVIDSDDAEVEVIDNPKKKNRVVETVSPVKVPRNRIPSVIQSSEDEVVVSSEKRATKSSFSKLVRAAKRPSVVDDSSSEEKTKPLPKRARQIVTSPMVMEVDESDSSDDQEPCSSTGGESSRKRGRCRTPPNQTKLDAILSKKVPAAKMIKPSERAKVNEVTALKRVDPLDFFNSSKSFANTTPLETASVRVVTLDSSDDDFDPEAVKEFQLQAKEVEKVEPARLPKKAKAEHRLKSVTPPKRFPMTKESEDITPSKSKKAEKIFESVKISKSFKPPVTDTFSTFKRLPLSPPVPHRLAELPWVDKYKPSDVKQIIGQGTPKSSVNKLLQWLKEWPRHNLGTASKINKPKPSPFMAQFDGTAFKAALLSGPPGIGKTTSAVLACKTLGFKYVEMNASDARNKKLLEAKVFELLKSHQINEFFAGEKPNMELQQVTHVLIMDEVDGMSGNQDRSGITELIDMIKNTRIPIICICNDRQSQKIRSLANHCFDLRFQRPRAEQIKGKLMTVCAREKLRVPKEQLDKLIEASNQDIRQCIYSLQLIAAGTSGRIERKDISVNIFEAARKILSKETKLAEKQELYFSDYSLMPLFVQENFPNVRGEGVSNLTHLADLRKAATCISEADIVDKEIRSRGNWSLLPQHALLSSAVPMMYINGHMSDQINFPSFLGKMSSGNKRQRMMRQLAGHCHLKISGSCQAIVTDYLPVLRDRMLRPLVKKDTDGVPQVVDLYTHYDITRDDNDAINELGVWPDQKDLAANIEPKTKAALTRALKKSNHLLPYSAGIVAKGKGRKETSGVGGTGRDELEIDEEGHLVQRKLGAGSDAEESGDEGGDGDAPDITIKTIALTGDMKKKLHPPLLLVEGVADVVVEGARKRDSFLLPILFCNQ